MPKIKIFVKKHWFFILLFGFICFLLIRQNPYPRPFRYYGGVGNKVTESYALPSTPMLGSAPALEQRAVSYSDESVSNVPSNDERMVVEDIYTSLKVKNVPVALENIKVKAESLSGFMVSSNFSSPGEVSSGNISVRVPEENQDEFVKYLEENSEKVVSYTVNAKDVTDAYQDTQERLRILEQNKARLEQIMESAETAEEMLNVQNSVFNVQRQIESLVGRQQYLEQTSSSVKFTIYVGTDEYALPYIPDNNYRPDVVLKNAVRSLVTTFRSATSLIIWLGVYAVIWVPLILIGYFAWRKYLK